MENAFAEEKKPKQKHDSRHYGGHYDNHYVDHDVDDYFSVRSRKPETD